MAGAVVVNEHRVDKPGTFVDTGAACRVKDEARSPYVSRGGQKLEAALRAFTLTFTGVVAIDVGCSTGGFTDCLFATWPPRCLQLTAMVNWRGRYGRTHASSVLNGAHPARLIRQS